MPVFTILYTCCILFIYILDTFFLVPSSITINTKEHILIGDKSGKITNLLKLSISQIRKGEIWRLFSSTLLHVGLFHILFNTIALLIVGIAVEDQIGTLRTFLLFLFSSVFSAFCMAFIFQLEDGEGASTGIYGLIGTFLLLSIKNRSLFFSGVPWFLLAVLCIYGIAGMCMDKTTTREHVSGLAGGILMSFILIFL